MIDMQKDRYFIVILLFIIIGTFFSCANYKTVDVAKYSNKSMPSINNLLDAASTINRNSGEEDILEFLSKLKEMSNYEFIDSGTFYNIDRFDSGVDVYKYFCIGKGQKDRKIFRKELRFDEGIVFIDLYDSELQLYFTNKKEMLAYLKQAEAAGFERLDYGRNKFCLVEDIVWRLHPAEEKKNVLRLRWE